MSNNNSMAKLYDKVKFFDNVKILPGNVINPPSEPPAPLIPLYALTRSVASTDEGTSITFTLSTANVANGTAVPYVINGISEQDLIAGSLTGSFVVNSGSSTLSFTIAEDALTEGTETLTLSAANKTASVSILDTSREPIYIVDPGLDYKLSRSVASANEGSVVAYTLSSWFFSQGDVVPYTIGGIAAEDLIAGSLTGSFVFGNTNTATLSFTIASDLLTEGSEVMTLSAIEKASSITINDTSTTPEFPVAYALTRSTASTNEGDYVTFTLSSVNVPAGTIIPYKVNGISQNDLDGGAVEGTFVIDYDGTATIGFILAQDLLTEGTETLTVSAANKTASISILDTSLSPQYTLARSVSAADEGTTVTYTLSSDTAPDNTLVPYTVTGINAADLSSGSLTGNFTVISKAASVSFTLANDLMMEGPETMTISAGGKTSGIAINDTSLNPLYALSRSAASTNEGTTVTYTLSTARVQEGTPVPYKITGSSAEDLSSGLLEGNFVIDGAGFATLSFTLANDQLTEGTETMTLSAGNRTSAISILDTSKAPVYTITRSAATANEGTMVTYRLSAAFVEVGTAVPYVITGISQEDLSFGSLEGNFVLGSSNTDTISAILAVDLLTEGTETMTIFVADKSSSITVNDTSLTPEVVLLLAGDGAEGASNNPTDISSNNFAITKIGTPTLTNLSPFNDGSGSAYFDGSGDRLVVSSNPNFEFGVSDFTIECWIYRQSSSSGTFISNSESDSNTNYFQFVLRVDGSLRFQIRNANNGGQWFSTTQPNSVPLDQWSHVAAIRESGAMKVYINGAQLGTMTIIQPSETPERSASSNSTNLLQRSVIIGAFMFTGFESYFNSYISNLRIVKGVAVYTSNFSVPTAPLTNVSNTVFLLNTPAPAVIDGASKNPVIYTQGNSAITTSVKKYGSGSLAFDGTGDYLQIPASSDLTLGIADFTIEFWCNFTSVALTSLTNPRIYANGINAANRLQVLVDDDATLGNVAGGITLYTTSTISRTTVAVNDGNWHHIAFARQGGVLRTFVDGVLASTFNNATNFNDSSTAHFVGAYGNGTSGFFNGYLDDFRITKGVALYTSNFTPPTGPLTINI